jgi:hypothetical protein
MKTRLLSILIFINALGPVSAADAPAPEVIIVSASSVTVDGVNYGAPIDAMKNNPQLTAAIQAALIVWQNQRLADVATAQAAQAAAEVKLKALVDGTTAVLALPTADQQIAAGQALIAKVQASEADAQKAALLQQQADIAAKLAALQAAGN